MLWKEVEFNRTISEIRKSNIFKGPTAFQLIKRNKELMNIEYKDLKNFMKQNKYSFYTDDW